MNDTEIQVPTPRISIGLRVTPETYRHLASFAKREGRSMANAAEVLVERALNENHAVENAA